MTAPLNDNFADAIILTGSLPITRTGDSNIDATTEVGEPLRINYGEIDPAEEWEGVAASVWYAWTCGATGVYEARIDTDFDSVLTVYTGASLASLTRIAQADVIWATPYYESCHFDAVSGTTYYFQASGWTGGPSGSIDFTLSASTRPANDDFADAIALADGVEISGTTLGASEEAGEPRDPDAYYYGIGKTVWYSFTPTEERAALIFTPSGRWYDDGLPRVTVYSGSTLATLTQVATGLAGLLSFTVTPGQTYYAQVGANPGYAVGSGDFDLMFSRGFDPSLVATMITLSDGSATSTVSLATAAAYPAAPAATGFEYDTESLWWRWAASGSGEATATFSSDVAGTVAFAIYDGDLVLLANGFATSGTLTPTSFTYAPGDYYFQFQADATATDDVTLELSVVADPLPPTENWEVVYFDRVSYEYDQATGSLQDDVIYADDGWTVAHQSADRNGSGVVEGYPAILKAASVDGPWSRYEFWSVRPRQLVGLEVRNGYGAVLTSGTTTPAQIHYWTDDPDAFSTVTIPWVNNDNPPRDLAADANTWAVTTRRGRIYANDDAAPNGGSWQEVYNFNLSVSVATPDACLAYLNGEWVLTAYVPSAGTVTNYTAADPSGPWTLRSEIELVGDDWVVPDGLLDMKHEGDSYFLRFNATDFAYIGSSIDGPWTTASNAFCAYYATDGDGAGVAGQRTPTLTVYYLPTNATDTFTPKDDEVAELPPIEQLGGVRADQLVQGVVITRAGFGGGEWLLYGNGLFTISEGSSTVPYGVVTMWTRSGAGDGAWGIALA